MPEVKRLINEASTVRGGVPFPELVKATTGHEVYKLDFEQDEDKRLYNEIVKSAENFLNYANRVQMRFQGDRINEIGKRIEEVFVEELKKGDLEPLLLSPAGYPDMKVTDQNGRVTYVESKAISKDWNSSFRAFYFTNGKKVNSDGRHLLIAWDIVEEEPKYWHVRGFKLCDLYSLKLKHKLEFNASNKVLYHSDLLLKN